MNSDASTRRALIQEAVATLEPSARRRAGWRLLRVAIDLLVASDDDRFKNRRASLFDRE